MKIQSNFKPAWWLKNPHLQTLWSAFLRTSRKVNLRFERFELSDGDFVDLAWLVDGAPDKPMVIVLHGLCGSIESGYAVETLHAIQQLGWQGVLMHFRGCSGESNRLKRSYHAGDTQDLSELVYELMEQKKNVPVAVIGYSLGGNVLLKWLGETGEQNPLSAAIAVSVPFDLSKVLQRFGHGFSRVYSKYLLTHMRQSVIHKFSNTQAPFDVKKIKKAGSFTEFDNEFTAPLHGFANAYDYYQRASSRHYLKDITVPTLILHAEDDPFMTPDAIPEAHELSSQVRLEISERGGHVGFVSGRWPWRPEYWLEKRIQSFLCSQIQI